MAFWPTGGCLVERGYDLFGGGCSELSIRLYAL